MPNTNTPGHLEITVGSTKTKLLVDPSTYSEVDITDFAPRAVSGTPTFSTLGLYLDVAQEGFNHGFGEWEFGEPKSYAYSGQLIDCRHGHIQQFTKYTQLVNDASVTINKANMMVVNTVPLFGSTTGLTFIRPSDNALKTWVVSGGVYNILNNGKYLFLGNTSRLQMVYLAQPTSATATTITFTGAGFEDTDQWVTGPGKVYIFDGTGASETKVTITASTADTITVGSWPAGTPDTSSWIALVANTGVASNPPNNYKGMIIFGGSMWGFEKDTNFLHFWAETNGSDAEGGGTSDASVVKVGTPGYPIVNLMPFNNQLYVFKENGIWVINEQDTDALAYHKLDFSSEAHADNFDTALVWQGFLIFTVRNKLYKYRSGLQNITPPVWYNTHPPKQFGAFKSIVTRGKFMYILGVSNAANSEETTETNTGFISVLCSDGVGWNKLLDLPLTLPGSSYAAAYDPVSDKMYLFGNESGGNGKIWTIPFQTFTDLPTSSYLTSGTFNWYSSYYDFGMKRINKSFASVTLSGEFPTNTQVVVSYRIDTATSFTTLGTFTSDFQEIDFPVGKTGKKIQLKLTFSTTDATATAMVKAIVLKVMLRPDVLFGITCNVLISDNLKDQNQMLLGHTAKELLTNLKAARNSVAPITLVDLHGNSNTVYLASLRINTVAYEDSDAVQTVAHCTFVNV